MSRSTRLAPVVAGREREDRAGRVDGGGGDRRLVALVARAQLGARVLVPEAVLAVTTYRRERLMHRVEHDRVHRVHVLVAVRRLRPVALEREVVLRVRRVHVLDCHAALDAAHREAYRYKCN